MKFPKAAAILLICAGGGVVAAQTASDDPGAQGREARIEAHRGRIEEVIRVNRATRNADSRTSGPVLPVNVVTAPDNPGDQGREARIAAHRGRIEEIIRVARTLSKVDRQTSEPVFPGSMLQPSEFEGDMLPLLKQVQATDAQAVRLREYCRKIWDKANVEKPSEADIEAIVKLRREQLQVLSESQAETLGTLFQKQRAARAESAKAQAAARSQQNPQPPSPAAPSQ